MAFAFSNHLPFAGGGRQSRLQLGFRNKGVSLLNLSLWSSERKRLKFQTLRNLKLRNLHENEGNWKIPS